MGIINRTKDASEQRERFFVPIQGSFGLSPGIPTGSTFMAAIVPYACVIEEAQLAAFGVSGSPTFNLALSRFITGTGFTTWILASGSSNIPAIYGTSGPGSFGASTFGGSGMLLLNASGSTLNILVANDVLSVTVAGSNASATSAVVGFVLRPTSDIKKNFGFSI
jgi:hypothetical protein